MRLFDLLAQFDVMESIRPDNHRKVYIGPGNEIIYRIQSQTKQTPGIKKSDVAIISKALFSPKKAGPAGLYTDDKEDSVESQGCCSLICKKIGGIFFSSR